MPTLVQRSLDRDAPSASESPSSSPSSPQSPSVAVRQRAAAAAGAKRKRANDATNQPSRRRRRSSDPSVDGSDEDDEVGRVGRVGRDGRDGRDRRDGGDNDDDDDDDDCVYDPDQPLEERRNVQKEYRDLIRDITEKGEEFLATESNGLNEMILKANQLSTKLRQTTEATIDSRLLVSTTDLSYRKTLRLTQGSLSQGIDADEFVSKCISYMRNGSGIADNDAPELSSTQRQRRRPTRGADDDDDIGDEGDMMNWSHLGRFVCLPHARRPALPGFLLGPLSVEKKARKITKRSAPFRPNNLTETRPEVLDVDHLAQRENDLTSICGKILQQLYKIQAQAQETVAELIEDDMDDEEKTRIMHQHGLRSTGGIDLMRFVVNPKSFSQTVENIFYVSFLIRDGRVEIDFDEDELPALAPVDREAEDNGAVRQGASKHQAVLSMDMKTWHEIIDVFNLTEPMIEHRQEAASSGPGARSWYS